MTFIIITKDGKGHQIERSILRPVEKGMPNFRNWNIQKSSAAMLFLEVMTKLNACPSSRIMIATAQKPAVDPITNGSQTSHLRLIATL